MAQFRFGALNALFTLQIQIFSSKALAFHQSSVQPNLGSDRIKDLARSQALRDDTIQ